MNTALIILVVLAAILGPAAVIAVVGYSSIKALGRNPSSAPKIMLAMTVILVFVEAICIIALLVLFQMFGK